MNEYVTRSIGKGIANVQDFVIAEESMARLVFRAKIYSGGVRGRLIRQRRLSKDDIWVDDTPTDIRTLEKGDNFNVELKTSAVAKLQQVISDLNTHVSTNGVEYGTNKYKTIKSNEVVISSGNISEVIKKIIDGQYSEEVLKAFSESKQVDLATFADAERVRAQRIAVGGLERRLQDQNGFPEVRAPFP